MCVSGYVPVTHFDLTSGIDRLHTQQEIENMCKPDDNKDDAGNPEAFSGHHEKNESHQQRHGDDDRNLCGPHHSAVFYKGFQMLVIELGPQKPVVQLLGAVGEEEDGQKIEWRCRQDWQEHTHRVQTQAMQPSITKKILLTLMTFSSSFSQLL